MTRDEHLYTIAGEEGCEIAQRCTKALRFGDRQVQPDGHDGLHPDGGNPEQLDNRQRILKEYADLVGVLEMLGFDVGLGLLHPLRPWVDAKKAKVERFLEYSRECGTLTEECAGDRP
ncbi:MAG: hypothetical protein AB7Q29_14890 [Vicinamibacterales bacterium]